MYRSHVLVCGGTGCTSSNSAAIIEALETQIAEKGLSEEIKVIRTGCFGLCALGPIMIVYPEGSFYSQVKVEDIPEIVEEHLLKGRIVTRLLYDETVTETEVKSLNDTKFYAKQERVALRNCGVIDPENIDEYIAYDGYQALAKCLTEYKPEDVINVIKESGICENFEKSLAKEHILCYNHDVLLYIAYLCTKHRDITPGKEEVKMENLKKHLSTILLVTGVVCLLIAVVIAVIAFTGWSENIMLINVLLLIAAILTVVLGGLVMYLAVISATVTRHFFLYDKNLGKNIKPSELTFEIVNKRMTYFMRKIANNERQVWSANIVGSDDERFGKNNVYRPLMAYKMIYDLTEHNRPEYWKLFSGADVAIISSICDALTENGDAQLGATLVFLREHHAENIDKISHFFMDNRAYMQKQMVKYVQAHIDSMYME